MYRHFRLPSLTSLAAFEAYARHRSVHRAAGSYLPELERERRAGEGVATLRDWLLAAAADEAE